MVNKNEEEKEEKNKQKVIQTTKQQNNEKEQQKRFFLFKNKKTKFRFGKQRPSSTMLIQSFMCHVLSGRGHRNLHTENVWHSCKRLSLLSY